MRVGRDPLMITHTSIARLVASVKMAWASVPAFTFEQHIIWWHQGKGNR